MNIQEEVDKVTVGSIWWEPSLYLMFPDHRCTITDILPSGQVVGKWTGNHVEGVEADSVDVYESAQEFLSEGVELRPYLRWGVARGLLSTKTEIQWLPNFTDALSIYNLEGRRVAIICLATQNDVSDLAIWDAAEAEKLYEMQNGDGESEETLWVCPIHGADCPDPNTAKMVSDWQKQFEALMGDVMGAATTGIDSIRDRLKAELKRRGITYIEFDARQ